MPQRIHLEQTNACVMHQLHATPAGCEINPQLIIQMCHALHLFTRSSVQVLLTDHRWDPRPAWAGGTAGGMSALSPRSCGPAICKQPCTPHVPNAWKPPATPTWRNWPRLLPLMLHTMHLLHHTMRHMKPTLQSQQIHRKAEARIRLQAVPVASG
jgi:hypothetical protein